MDTDQDILHGYPVSLTNRKLVIDVTRKVVLVHSWPQNHLRQTKFFSCYQLAELRSGLLMARFLTSHQFRLYPYN